jgi:L-ascorbate metabolism protein UlaG (beta-lactamase superfamily)
MKKKITLALVVLAAVVLVVVVATSGTTLAPVVGSPPAGETTTIFSQPGQPVPAKLAIMRIAHSSTLVDFDGEIVLTDPWFTESSQYHHGEPLGVALGDLPRLAAVVVSHGHFDHFDIDAFAAYPHKDVPMFVVAGLAGAVRKAGFTNVHELSPWESAQAGLLTITAAPAKHGVPEVTYVLQGKGSTVYFGGDSELIPALDEIPKRFPKIDVALLPVNGLHAFGTQVVMSDVEAATLAGKLHAAVAVPIHYAFHGGWFSDTFILSYHGTPEGFARAAKASAPETDVRILVPGQRLEIDHAMR